MDKLKTLLKKTIVWLGLSALAYVAFILYFGLKTVTLPEDTTIKIQRGDTLYDASISLEDKSIIDNARIFRIIARFFGTGDEIKAGEYQFTDGESNFQVLQKIYRGYFAKNRIRIQEGWTFKDLRDALYAHEALDHRTIHLSNADILSKLEIEHPHPEGLFFPDTYIFSGGESDLEILRIAHKKLLDVLATEWDHRTDNIQFETPYDALILASIIEKETSLKAEKPIVGGVFNNRLAKGMRLQADPTVIYGVGDNFDGDIRYKDLQDNNPYNTYKRDGLPPSPIALASKSSIRAAMQPAATSALYFVAKGDGTHKFSNNLKEHNKAVRKYQR